MEQLAVRFRDVDTANKFKTVFDRSKEKMTPSKTEGAVSDGGQAGGAGVSPASVSRRLFQQEEGEWRAASQKCLSGPLTE